MTRSSAGPIATGPAGRQPMAAVDCAWLRMDAPDSLMVINGLMFFDRPLDPTRVRGMLSGRLTQVRRFRQRAVRLGARRWAWEEAEGFEVDAHLAQERLRGSGGDQELRELVGRRMAEPLPLELPLWRLHLVHGYRGGSVMLWRLHHAVGDGIALTVLLLALTDLDPEADRRTDGGGPWGSGNPLAGLFGDPPVASVEGARRFLEELLPEGSRMMLRPAEALAAAGRWLTRAASVPAFGRLAARPSDPASRLKGPLGGVKRVAWSGPIPLVTVQAARRRLGGTVNDVLVAAATGALRRYLETKGDRTHRLRFRAVVPVSLRPLTAMHELGNRFGLVFLSLPVGISEPRARLAELRFRMGALKRSVEPVVVLAVLRLLGQVPKRVQDLVIRIFGTKGTVVLSSLPGPARELYLAGEAIRGLVFWVPQAGRLGLGMSMMTYAGEMRVGVASDSAVVPDPEALVVAFEEELVELAASAPPAQGQEQAQGEEGHGRVPGAESGEDRARDQAEPAE